MSSRPGLRVGRSITVEQRRRDVLQAALQCIAVSGYENVRLRDISKAAGVSTGLLQHHFETREELLEHAFHQASADLLDGWVALRAQGLDPWQQIAGLVSQLSDREDVRAHCITWTEYATAAARHESLRSGFTHIYARWQEFVHTAIEEGEAAGLFRPVLPVSDVVAILLAHIDGCELAIASNTGVMTADRMRDLTLFLAAQLLQHTPPGEETPGGR